MTELTFKFKQSNGINIELSIEDAKQLYQNLHELFGTSSVPQYPIYPIYPNFRENLINSVNNLDFQSFMVGNPH
jgi:hypothetical protein